MLYYGETSQVQRDRLSKQGNAHENIEKAFFERNP